jgi:hypothetical protein
VVLIDKILEEYLLFAAHHLAGKAVTFPVGGEVLSEKLEEIGVLFEDEADVLADP